MNLFKVALIAIGLSLTSPQVYALEPIFNARVDYQTGKIPISICSADFNGDGKPDLASGNWGSGNIAILINKGDGTFDSASYVAAGIKPSAICAGDFDGDNKPDLAVVNSDSATILILKNNGDGTFVLSYTNDKLSYPEAIYSSDLDGNGTCDLTVGTYSVSILKNDGAGIFSSPVGYSLGWGGACSSVISYDLNGDGKPDLAVTRLGAQPDVASNISILVNKGDGTFASAVHYGSWLDPASVCAADFDGDGRPDLAVTHALGVSVLKNNGDGVFANGGNYSVAYNSRSILARDFDADGKPDLAVANSNNNSIMLMKNNGDGTFANAVGYATAIDPWSLCEADFNNDGKPDLAVANPSSNSISVLINCYGSINDVNEPQQHVTSDGFTLAQNCPNPFNPTTTIKYDLPSRSHVVIDVFNILGQRVRQLADETKPAGTYQINWDGTDQNGISVSTGIYLYRLRTDKFVETKKMLLLR